MIALEFLGALGDFEILGDISLLQVVKAFGNWILLVHLKTFGDLDAVRGGVGGTLEKLGAQLSWVFCIYWRLSGHWWI